MTTLFSHSVSGVPHFARVSGLAVLDKRLKAAAVRLLAVLALYASRDGLVLIDQSRLAALLGLSDNPATHRPALSRALRELEDAGYLDRLGQIGLNRPARYRLKTPSTFDASNLNLSSKPRSSSAQPASSKSKASEPTGPVFGDADYSGPVPHDDEDGEPPAPSERLWQDPSAGLITYKDAVADHALGPDLSMFGNDIHEYFGLDPLF